MTLYVKKLYTLNPVGHKYITLDKAMQEYKTYVKAWCNWQIADKTTITLKSFQQWLKTEI